ncbi:MAG: hypothetical protein AB7K52_02465 [Phycisphaerales bacterium]
MRLRSTRRLTVFGIAVMAMGLLLWARLILVTGHPREAIADPRQQQRRAAMPVTPADEVPEGSSEQEQKREARTRDSSDPIRHLQDDPRFMPAEIGPE